MSERPVLRIAFAFALALTIAQAADLEVTFIAPLVAGTLAALPAPPPALLIGLPLIAWGLMIGVVAMTGLLASWPLALMLAMVGIFLVGFRLSARPRLGAITLLLLVLFAVALLGAGLAYAALVLMLVRGRQAGAAAPPASRQPRGPGRPQSV